MCLSACFFLLLSSADNQCLDYLHMTRTVYNDDYCTCGRVGVGGQTLSSLGIPDQGMEFERMTMTLRSNSDCRGFGALISVSCIDGSAAKRRKRNADCKPTFVNPQLQRDRSRVSSSVVSTCMFVK